MNKLAKVMSKTVKGTQFISVKGYENQKGEISNYSVAMGYNHGKMKATELAELLATSPAALSEALPEHGYNIIAEAYGELVTSRTMNAEDNAHIQGQLDAYITLANGVKIHKETESAKITGLLLRKKVIAHAPDYAPKKPVKSSAKTLANRAIEKLINKKNKAAFGNIVMFDIEKGAYAMQKAKIE